MRPMLRLSLAAAIVGFLGIATQAAASGDVNPNEYGLYSPEDKGKRVYRYDPRSWYYRRPGYYPFYASSYWVPRAHMRYRYRRFYYGPRYRYHPAWGYPRPGYYEDCCR